MCCKSKNGKLPFFGWCFGCCCWVTAKTFYRNLFITDLILNSILIVLTICLNKFHLDWVSIIYAVLTFLYIIMICYFFYQWLFKEKKKTDSLKTKFLSFLRTFIFAHFIYMGFSYIQEIFYIIYSYNGPEQPQLWIIFSVCCFVLAIYAMFNFFWCFFLIFAGFDIIFKVDDNKPKEEEFDDGDSLIKK